MEATAYSNTVNTNEYSDGNLTTSEFKAVTAVVAYISYSQGIGEDCVWAGLMGAFGVDDAKDISSENYDDAIRFLVDFYFDETVN